MLVFSIDLTRCVSHQVETLGDAVYMAAGGVPDPTTDHGVRVAGVALTLKQMVEDRFMNDHTDQVFNIRIGKDKGDVSPVLKEY